MFGPRKQIVGELFLVTQSTIWAARFKAMGNLESMQYF